VYIILATTLVGITGMLETTQLWIGIPTTGTGYELDVIAMVEMVVLLFWGGASLMGGGQEESCGCICRCIGSNNYIQRGCFTWCKSILAENCGGDYFGDNSFY